MDQKDIKNIQNAILSGIGYKDQLENYAAQKMTLYEQMLRGMNGQGQTNTINIVKRKLNNDKIPIFRIRRGSLTIGPGAWYAEEQQTDDSWKYTGIKAWTKWGINRKLRNSLYVEKFEP